MASTNKTTNLELSQFIGSDSPKWLTDYNADMEKIDAGYQTVKAQADATDLVVSGHTSSISTLQDTTTSQGTAITGLRTDVNGNSGSINTINELLGNGEPTTTNKTIIGAINELDGNVGSLDSLATTAKNNIVSAVNEVNTIATNTHAGLISNGTALAEVTADGVKTLDVILSDLHTALDAALALLPATSHIKITRINIPNLSLVSENPELSTSSGFGSAYFSGIFCNGSATNIYVMRFGPNNTDCHYNQTTLEVGGTVTTANHDTDVPASGSKFRIIGIVIN